MSEIPMVLKSVDPFDPNCHECNRANYNYYDDDQYNPTYYEEEGEFTGGTPGCYRGWSPSYTPATPTRQAGPSVPVTPMRRTPSAVTSTGKGKAKVEEDSKPQTSTPSNSSLPTSIMSQSHINSVPKVEFEEQNPIVPSTLNPRSRSVRTRTTPVKAGVKRELDSDSEGLGNDSDDDFVPGQKGSHSAKKRKTKKV